MYRWHHLPEQRAGTLYCSLLRNLWASLVAQMVKNPPAMKETWVRPLDWEDPLEEGMATHSSTVAWRIPMDREAWWTTVPGIAKSQTQLSAMQAHAHLCARVRTHTHKHAYTARKSKVLCF